ncbi:MAG: hypothetical protein AMS21_10230 [Gemmatimonas sp. SG8_38_2]|nr:MAG: hypothetical protein AMS21_10230 [Gemmatimonas sp. SG8_38_2]
MPESRSVNLVVDLPVELADEVERLQRTDPEFIEKVLAYGLVRRAVFARLRGVTALQRSSASPVESTYEASSELT